MTHRQDKPPVSDSEELSLLHSYLGDRDVSCPSCGYNLRGLTGSSCPECGDAISLTITNYPSRSGGYIAGLIGYTLSIVFALVFVAGNWKTEPVLSVLSVFIVAWIAVAMVRWHRNRVAFSALPRHKKQERLFLCWLGAVIFFLAIVTAGIATS